MKRRPITQQEKDALSLRMKLNNPMHIPEVKQRAAKTRMKRHGKEFSERMKSLHQQGRIPHHSHTIEQRKQASERMKKTNPMKNPEIAQRVRLSRLWRNFS